MSIEQPVYVAHRKWFFFLLGAFLVLIALFGIYVFINSIPEVPSNLNLNNLIFVFAIEAILFLSASYPLWTFLKSKRMEFYLDFVRVFLSWGGKTKDIPYSKIELGRLKVRMIRGGISFHFKLNVRGQGKASSWDVADGNIEKSDSLYSWLRRKISLLDQNSS